MTIRHLNIFLAVAEYGTMSAAAEHLYLSQPTVSQSSTITVCYLNVWARNCI